MHIGISKLERFLCAIWLEKMGCQYISQQEQGKVCEENAHYQIVIVGGKKAQDAFICRAHFRYILELTHGEAWGSVALITETATD